MTRLLMLFVALLALAPPGAAQPRDTALVLAAASLQESLTEAAAAWEAAGHPRPVISFAASSTLARQVEAGAPADLFFSADTDWMDHLADRGLIAPGSRIDLLGNRLVVLAMAGTGTGRLRNRREIAATLSSGPVAMADPDSVPAGKYGKAALTRLGVWDRVAPHVVRAENVRAAMALVERGAARYAIVYETDYRAARAARRVGTFPAASHPPIVYPLARLKRSTSAEAEGFRRFLIGAQGKAIFRKYGFATR